MHAGLLWFFLSMLLPALLARPVLAAEEQELPAVHVLLLGRTVRCSYENPGDVSSEERRLCQILRNNIMETGVPGAIVAVSAPSGVVVAVAAGVAQDASVTRSPFMPGSPDELLRRKWSGSPAEPGMHSRVGSVTKMFTAVVLLRLQEQGVLDLDDTVAHWLGADFYPNAEQATIRQLLQMTSGYTEYTELDAWEEQFYDDPSAAVTPQQLVALAKESAEPTLFAPGLDWKYANTNYVIAALIAEQATGSSWQELVQQEVLRPLALTSTLAPPDNSIAMPEQYFSGYLHFDAKWHDMTALNPTNFLAAGDLISTVKDLAVFINKLLGGELLQPDSLSQMKNYVAMDDGGHWDGSEPGYGLGLGFLNGAVGHNGSLPGYLSECRKYGEHSFAVFTSGQPLADAGEILWDVIRLYYPEAGNSNVSQPQ